MFSFGGPGRRKNDAHHLTPAERRAKRRHNRRRRAAAAAAAAAFAGGAGLAAHQDGGGGNSDNAEVLRLHNQLRDGVGCNALHANGDLDKAAQAKADNMARYHYMSHTWPDGSQWYTHIEKYYRGGGKEGENIAEGFDSPGSVTTAWRNSPEHWRNISDCGFTKVGIAHNGGYWSVEFAN